jgi:biopolymer transport protein TolQ
MGNQTLDVIQLIIDAGPIAKLVLAILGFFSIVSWSIILEKVWQFQKIKSQSKSFLTAFDQNASLQTVYDTSVKSSESPLSEAFLAFYREAGCANAPSESKNSQEAVRRAVLNDSALQMGARGMKRAAGREIQMMEKHLLFLATTASVCPFIGLFGTVWGVMDSFRGIGLQGSANLAVVAPGISEALIATAAGLAAAIPAVMAYNFFVNRVKYWARELESLNMAVLNYFQRS